MAKSIDSDRLDRVVLDARRQAEERQKGYREQALKMYPWICGRCSREFDRTNLSQLTVHHRDHNHDNNPPDGSNWELLCLYCHDNEHQKQLEAGSGGVSLAGEASGPATFNPFADLKSMLAQKK
ncbi:HNH nuclease family protein [Ectothiorhodospiraceae bacterium BW-2]|nr:HNH nuclease family protein [Ectothiorhodospiraceae bacterium BW-2]